MLRYNFKLEESILKIKSISVLDRTERPVVSLNICLMLFN